MTAKEYAATQSSASSSTWSGPTPGGRSIITFNSSTDSDPYWREPVARLQRWKHQVAEVMKTLREDGQEGRDVIKKQELRARGRHTDLLMSDGSPLPEDLGFRKARFEYFAQEWRRIQQARGTYVSIRDSINPAYDWIYIWIINTEAARGDYRPDATKGVVCERRPSELPAAMVCQNQVAKKRRCDSIDGADKDDALPSKRSKRNPPNDTKTNASKPNTRKVTVARSRLYGGMAENRDKAGAEQVPTARQPLRRSPRIAALEAAKAANIKKESVGRLPPATTTTTAAKS